MGAESFWKVFSDLSNKSVINLLQNNFPCYDTRKGNNNFNNINNNIKNNINNTNIILVENTNNNTSSSSNLKEKGKI